MKVCDKCKCELKKSMVNARQAHPNVFDDLKDLFEQNSVGNFVEQYEQNYFIINLPKRKQIYDLCESCSKKMLKLTDGWFKTK